MAARYPSLLRAFVLTLFGAWVPCLQAQDPTLKDAFQQAKLLWATEGNREGAVAKFEQIQTALEPKIKTLDNESMQMLCVTYNWLAVLYDRTPAKRAQVSKIFETLVELSPDFDIDRNVTNARLQGVFDGIKSSKLAHIKLTLSPEGGILTVDGKPRPSGAIIKFLPPGPHRIAYSRLGYRLAEEHVELMLRETKTLDLKLERISSTVTLYTSPANVEVVLDGKSLGLTTGQATSEQKALADKVGLNPEQLSAGFVLCELSAGKHIVELKAPCYKPRRFELGQEIATPFADHVMDPITLESSRGSLTVETAWAGGELFLSGKSYGPLPIKDVAVCTGTYDLQVKFPMGGYTQKIEIQEGKNLALTIKPKPRIAYVGFEGREDFGGRDRITQQLLSLGERCKELAFVLPTQGETPEAAKARIKASKEAELILEARPLSEKPNHQIELVLSAITGESDRMVVKPLEQDPLGALVLKLNTLPALWEPWTGAVLVDLPGEKGPWVIQADAQTQRIGLKVGKAITLLNGKPVSDCKAFRQALQDISTGKVQVSQGDVSVTLPLSRQALEIPTNSASFCYPVLLADLRLRSLGAQGDEAGMLRFNQALALMHFREFDKAMEILRDTRVTIAQGVGQGTIDFYTGFCLLHMGNVYLSEAQQAFNQAMKYPQATLFGPEGPLVAPLAKQALEDLRP